MSERSKLQAQELLAAKAEGFTDPSYFLLSLTIFGLRRYTAPSPQPRFRLTRLLLHLGVGALRNLSTSTPDNNKIPLKNSPPVAAKTGFSSVSLKMPQNFNCPYGETERRGAQGKGEKLENLEKRGFKLPASAPLSKRLSFLLVPDSVIGLLQQGK